MLEVKMQEKGHKERPITKHVYSNKDWQRWTKESNVQAS